MTEWTPAPWTARLLDPTHTLQVIEGPDEVWIADVASDSAAADARLIAKAPEMAALLQRLVDGEALVAMMKEQSGD